jgi:hypothetical protein
MYVRKMVAYKHVMPNIPGLGMSYQRWKIKSSFNLIIEAPDFTWKHLGPTFLLFLIAYTYLGNMYVPTQVCIALFGVADFLKLTQHCNHAASNLAQVLDKLDPCSGELQGCQIFGGA